VNSIASNINSLRSESKLSSNHLSDYDKFSLETDQSNFMTLMNNSIYNSNNIPTSLPKSNFADSSYGETQNEKLQGNNTEDNNKNKPKDDTDHTKLKDHKSDHTKVLPKNAKPENLNFIENHNHITKEKNNIEKEHNIKNIKTIDQFTKTNFDETNSIINGNNKKIDVKKSVSGLIADSVGTHNNKIAEHSIITNTNSHNIKNQSKKNIDNNKPQTSNILNDHKQSNAKVKNGHGENENIVQKNHKQNVSRETFIANTTIPSQINKSSLVETPVKNDNVNIKPLSFLETPITHLEQKMDSNLSSTNNQNQSGNFFHLNEKGVISTRGEEPLLPKQASYQFDQMLQNARILVKANGNASLTTQLYPKELGKISINLSITDGKLKGKLTVESESIKKELSDKITQLISDLKDDGYIVENLDVNVQPESYRQFSKSSYPASANILNSNYQQNQQNNPEFIDNIMGINNRGMYA